MQHAIVAPGCGQTGWQMPKNGTKRQTGRWCCTASTGQQNVSMTIAACIDLTQIQLINFA
jgi:hypothetical protein